MQQRNWNEFVFFYKIILTFGVSNVKRQYVIIIWE
jgi:hypothetical protein